MAKTRVSSGSDGTHSLDEAQFGLHLLDYLQLDALAPLCDEVGRWSFLVVIAPLRMPTVTGSLVNPIAIL